MLFQLLSQNPAEEVFDGLENWCILFNEFFETFFIYMKYIFVFMLFTIGIATFLKLRGMYRVQRLKGFEPDEKMKDQLRTPRLVIGSLSIFLAIGILFNFLTYFLILILDPLPDRFIFAFINFSESIDPVLMNRIEDIEHSIYPHEKTIYYCVAIGSLTAIIQFTICVYLFVNNNNLKNPHQAMIYLMGDIITGMMCGFTTCLPFFL